MCMVLYALRWTAAGLLLAFTTRAQPQPEQLTNPVGRSEQAIAEGHELYNRTCTVCHGLNGAAGDRAPALGGGRSYVIRTDQGIFEAVQKGIPGSGMPASALQPTEIWKIVAYIRSLRATASDAFVPGDVAKGERIFWEKGGCGSCHMIRGRGGISGPDLSNVAGERTLDSIRNSLTKAKLQIPRGYQPVEIVTTDGRRLSGIAKNDNNFSLQLLDSNDRLQLFTSDELAKVTYGRASLMPSNYGKLLAPDEFQDLLAFLAKQLVHKVERRRRSEEQ
jgi:putative heme-binding domain-containing protein